MLLAQHSGPEPGLWWLGHLALWSAALSAHSGGDHFGGRRIVITHAGLIIHSTGIAGTIPADGTIIERTGGAEIRDTTVARPRSSPELAMHQSEKRTNAGLPTRSIKRQVASTHPWPTGNLPIVARRAMTVL